MAPESVEIQCSNSQCRVVETGKCVEGLALDKCPHILKVAVGSQTAAAGPGVGSADAPPDIALAKSERLTVEEATAVMRAAPAKVIGIVGPTSSGKTSLIASLCDLFQRGQIENLQFARSRTLFAFEQACHHSRATSRRNSPQTEHTSLASGLGFYHLGIRKDEASNMLQLLLADRSGEDYRSVADDPANASEFVELRRADVITALVNGELLLDLKARHNVRQGIVMILQGLLNGAILSAHQRLAVVLTKLDTIRGAPAMDRERAERDFAGLVKQIETIFGSGVRDIHSFSIAASPATTVLPHGFGVPKLLQFWSEAVPRPFPSLIAPRSSRAMGRFGVTGIGRSL